MSTTDCLTGIDAVILAGGLGTRIRPVLPDRPKVMAPVGGKPFLGYVLNLLSGFGVSRVVLSLGHMASNVTEYIETQSRYGLELVSHVEKKPMGTGGALREVLHLIESDTAIVLNGDAFARADFCKFLDFHRSRAASISILLSLVDDIGRYGLVKTDCDGMVLSFEEKPQIDGHGDGYVNAGVYLFERTAITTIPYGRPTSLEKEIFPKYCGRGLHALNGEFPFIDIGTPESYALADSFLGDVLHDN